MTVPFTPSGVDHFVLWIRGLEDARRWYKSVLGCRDGYDYPDIAMTHLWYGPVLIGLWDADDPKSSYAKPPKHAGKNLHHIALSWTGSSEEDVRAHLEASGVTIIKELRQTGSRGLGMALYFNDPWENLIELKGPATLQ
ncbi:MAG: VOC family protein [Pseudomonadota bacterium]